MKVIRTLEDPTAELRVELRQHANNYFSYRLFAREGSRWKPSKACFKFEFSSYAGAFVRAARELPWLANAVGAASNDSRHAYHLELSRGLAFRFATFSAMDFANDHDHCIACMAKFADFESDGILHEGFVTKYVIPDGSGHWQWNWVCAACFRDFQESLAWRLEPAG